MNTPDETNNGEEKSLPGEDSIGNDPQIEPGETAEALPAKRSLASRIKRQLIRVGVLAVFFLIVFIGATVVLYPKISNYINNKNASRVIDDYNQSLREVNEEDYTAFLQAARAYNVRLAGSGAAVEDAFNAAAEDKDKSDDYWNLLNVKRNGMMGYVEISELNIMLPLFHGTSEAVLATGAGHLHGSSLPVGGESTHAVVSAHTGLPMAKLFTGVDTLNIGDTFTLHIFRETLTYKIDQILTVLPYEIDELAIVNGKDYVTLVTCTPYGINTHRLLIRGIRTENPIIDENSAPTTTTNTDEEQPQPGWFKKTTDAVVVWFSNIIEKVAQAWVELAEWGIDLLGLEF